MPDTEPYLGVAWHDAVQATLADVPWEGASMRQGYYYAVYLGT